VYSRLVYSLAGVFMPTFVILAVGESTEASSERRDHSDLPHRDDDDDDDDDNDDVGADDDADVGADGDEAGVGGGGMGDAVAAVAAGAAAPSARAKRFQRRAAVRKRYASTGWFCIDVVCVMSCLITLTLRVETGPATRTRIVKYAKIV
jgi:hypothetical protein